MADRTSWWRSLTFRKKAGPGLRDPSAVQQDSSPDPPPAPDTTTISTNSKPATESSNNSQLITDETYDDSQFEPAFNERTCRRNLKISRSGRFKEKRRIRATLPENNNFYEGKDAAAPQEGLR